MSDLHATYYDAQQMYDFMSNVMCKDLSEITIMSDKYDYFRLYKKP